MAQADDIRIRGVMETVLYCEDLVGARRFYHDLLGLPVVTEDAGHFVFFAAGPNRLLVFDPHAATNNQSDVGGRPIPRHGAIGPGHLALAVPERELSRWRERLEEAAVAIESDLEWPQGGRSIYVRDPGGNSVELVSPKIWGEDDDIFDGCSV